MNSMEFLKFNGNSCRICLIESVILDWNEEMFEFSNITYKDCYFKYTELDADDASPTKLCEDCSSGLKNAHLLFKKAKESIFILKNALRMEEVDKQHSSTYLADVETDEQVACPETIKFEIEETELSDVNNNSEDENPINIDEIGQKGIFNKRGLTVTEKPAKSNQEIKLSEQGHCVDITNYEAADDLLEQNENRSVQSTKKPVKKKRKLLCVYCSLQCDSGLHLQNHEETHNEHRKRVETCPICGLKLYNKMNLKTHLKTHQENRQKEFKCEFCEKAFFNRGGLNIHRRVHLGQMVSCRLCSKEFYRKIDLNKHLLKHSGAPSQNSPGKYKYTVQCTYCSKNVSTTTWKAHKAAHLNQPHSKCIICDKNFFDKSKCSRHLKRAHGKTRDEYSKFTHIYEESTSRLTHLMIKQQEKVQINKTKIQHNSQKSKKTDKK